MAKVGVANHGESVYSFAVHHGQWDQNSRSTPQPHLPQVSLEPAIFQGGRTFVWHQGQ